MYKKFLDKYIVHDRLKEIPFVHSKARILASLHVFAMGLGMLFLIMPFVLDYEEQVPIFSGMVVILCLTITYRCLGNLVLSGNLLAAIIFLVLASTTYTTGGIYSDNFLWTLMVPLIALLFANRISGFFWLGCQVLLGLHLYFSVELSKPIVSTFETMYDTDYFLTSYTCFFMSIIFIVHIFESSREEIITLLSAKNEEIKEKKLQLERQNELLVEQATALEKLSHNLMVSNADLENFAHAASHDLKQPLRVIKSFIQILSKDKSLNLDAQKQEYMNFIIQSSQRMECLLNDLLALSRLGKDNPTPERLDLNDLMVMVTNNLSSRIRETNAQVRYDNLPIVKAPSSLMTQLFQNLISNGIKFQRENCEPVIIVKGEIQNDEVLISIEDNGIGIEEKNQQKIFEVFRRLHTQEEYEGSGIGLHTCKRIISSIDKKIWLTSEYGKGTIFFFTLPLFVDSVIPNQGASPAPSIGELPKRGTANDK